MIEVKPRELENGLHANWLPGLGVWRVYSRHGAAICDIPEQLVEALPMVAEAFN